MPADLDALLRAHRDGGGWAPLARAITAVENAPPWAVEIPVLGDPVPVIGLTGPPGVGKSTLSGRLIESYSAAGARVAVLAVDPSSAVSGGAVLGDRVRMEPHLEGSETAFVRSLASRGSTGALASSTRNVARVLESSGSFDVIIVETVGAGQTEVAIAGLADIVVLVTVPGLGDAVQAIKAGLMEVAEVLVVNMADRPGARETARHLRVALGRDVPVTQTVAATGEGVAELIALFDARWQQLTATGDLASHRAAKRTAEAAMVAQEWVRRCAATHDRRTSPTSLPRAVLDILEEAARTWPA
jgi:LAO/AO transport system kinase